ncbi:MAG: hypothetical protein QM537_09055 [Candidatus Symbiobacter sp.]|nr:hypothetical protein [Candidatus Symbiobacter sp.]
MENIGETLVGDYLKVILGCDFVAFNLNTKDTRVVEMEMDDADGQNNKVQQGEIDVVGINTTKKEVYLCEVAIHLETGLQYVKDKRPNNVNKLVDKFIKDIDYAENFEGYTKNFMLWTPIVKNSREGAKNNQANNIAEIKQQIKEKKGIEIIVICNQDFQKCLKELRDYAASKTEALNSPVLRYLQIEEKLKKHCTNLDKKSGQKED